MEFEYKPISGRNMSLNFDGRLTTDTEALNLKVRKFKEEYSVFREDNLTFSEFASELIKKRKWDRATFKDRTLLDDSTYTRIINAEDRKWDFKTIIAFCVGLELHLKTTENLLESAGHAFGTSKKYQGYKFLFTEFRGWPIDECNAFLENIGLSLLGNSPRKGKDEF